MYKTIRLTESELIRVIKKVKKTLNRKNNLFEQRIIKGVGSDQYDYMEDNGEYFTKLKNQKIWTALKNTEWEAGVKKLFGSDKGNSQEQPTPIKKSTLPFTNNNEANVFRAWVNKKYPNIAKELDLSSVGTQSDSYYNDYIQKAWKYYVGAPPGGSTLGNLFLKSGEYDYLKSQDNSSENKVKPKTGGDEKSPFSNKDFIWNSGSSSGKPSFSKSVDDNKKTQSTQGPSDVTIKPLNPIETKQYCPYISSKSTNLEDLANIQSHYRSMASSSNIWEYVNMDLNFFAGGYIKQGIPTRTACQIALNKIRPGYKDKNSIILDSLNKLVYVYDKSGKFVGKDVTITGANKQSQDPKVIAQALLSWEENVNQLGFEWKEGAGYIDVTGKGRKYDHELVYDLTNKTGTRFLPSGIYKTGKNTRDDASYAGGSDNIVSLFKGNTDLGQAIHGYYLEQPRTLAIQKAKKLLANNVYDPKVTQEFLDAVGSGQINLSQSYGCINVPDDFVPILRKYMLDAYVFNMSETGENYLVDNAQDFFKKTMNSEFCPSPKSLGAKYAEDPYS